VSQVPLIIEPDEDEPDFASVLVDATIAGRPYRLTLDTGAGQTDLTADEYTRGLTPVGEDSSAGVFGVPVVYPVVTITDLAVGSLRLAALDVRRSERGAGGVLGMDVLGQHRCHFRLDAAILNVDSSPGAELENELLMDRRRHAFIEVHWPGASGRALWDTGSGPTIVNRDFWLRHPGLFEQIGVSAGTDASGERAETPLLLMAESVIGQRTFGRHKAVAVDLSGVNSTADYPTDLILGYPTLRQADWLFDFPARRWTLTQ
jgi:gag-polyprotein putative aspartyl protease